MKVYGTISYTKIMQIGLGQGMNSEVFLADDPQLGGKVAAKEIEKIYFANPNSYFTEAQTMFAVAHDNVVAVQYACQTPTTISLVMPYFKHGSLADRIQNTPLQLSEVLRVTQGVLAGLAHIHLARFIHFDVKPSNVLFQTEQTNGRGLWAIARHCGWWSLQFRRCTWFQPPETVLTGVVTPARRHLSRRPHDVSGSKRR